MTQNATVWRPYAQMQTALPAQEIARTDGATLTLADGRKLIDGVASWWTACHGYNHPHIIHAIQQQAAILPHFMLGELIHQPAQILAQRLAELLPGDLDYVFYSETGSVAVEIAMKMALQYWINHQTPQKKQFVYFENGYHGDTFFTMSVSDPQDGIHPPFQAVLPPQYLRPLPTTSALLEEFEIWLSKNADHIAAVILEPLVQAAGGMKMHSTDTLRQICEVCQRFGVLIIADEVFTGFGRTGSLFAIEQTAVTPDIVCLSKALTGGTLALAATIARRHVYEAFLGDTPAKGLMHGTTFMGNALACAAANASLDLFATEPRIHQTNLIEELLLAELQSLKDVPGVKEVRVKGAIGVVQLAKPINTELNWFKHHFIQDGVWCRPFGDIVYTTPALTIGHEELLCITKAIVKQVTTWSKHFYTHGT